MIQLRDYQAEAVQSVANAWKAGKRRVLLELGPAAGKSIICAEMCKKAVRNGLRVLVLCHKKEILKQNHTALKRLNYSLNGTIYCDGLDEKNNTGDVVFAHRDSYYLCTDKGRFGLVIIDECHMLSQRPNSKYQTILAEVESPFLVGLTATPYRLQGGKVFGNNKPFEIRAYKLGINELIKRNALTPYKFIEDDPQVIGGESNKLDYEALGAKAIQDKTIQKSVDLIHNHTFGLRCILIFCCSRKHAKAIQGLIPGCAYVDGDTPRKERKVLIDNLRAGKIRYCVNVNILTTGTDIPIVDGIVMLRPTLSASLYIQTIGRGLRLFPGKKILTILELTDNLVRFGDINDPMEYGKEKEKPEDEISLEGEAPTKKCPECKMEVSAPTRCCPHCDYLFIKQREQFDSKETVRLNVKEYWYRDVVTKAGDNAVVVDFITEVGKISEWLIINHKNKWVATQSRAKLKRIKRDKIRTILVKGIKENYPRVLTYHT